MVIEVSDQMKGEETSSEIAPEQNGLELDHPSQGRKSEKNLDNEPVNTVESQQYKPMLIADIVNRQSVTYRVSARLTVFRYLNSTICV